MKNINMERFYGVFVRYSFHMRIILVCQYVPCIRTNLLMVTMEVHVPCNYISNAMV